MNFYECWKSCIIVLLYRHINMLWPQQNGQYFADIFKLIFIYEKCCILIQISPKFVPKGPINNS